MIPKERLDTEIRNEIDKINKTIGNAFSTEVSNATNRVAISNLYIALSNLNK